MSDTNKLPQVSEQQMHIVRWVLTTGWFVMILSLFWNPISSQFTNSSSPFFLLRFDPNQCVLVQGTCLVQTPPSIALLLFWSIVVPASILILLVLGHDAWRRICPLAFVSQLPRALGIQRKQKSAKSAAGAVRYELVKIKKDSWLGQNHLYVQFGLLAIGLAARLLLINADRVALGVFLLLTILAAIGAGYLYEGKSWCQYFCPMAPVQMVFTGPRGLLGKDAHQGQRQSVTQSMCRTIDKDGQEKSACVGCQSPCIDIDAERNYWETAAKPGRRFIQYGYAGLLVGFFCYTLLYAGNFDYLFSGAWLREANPFSRLWSPGFYVVGRSLPIPKLAAVFLTFALFVAISNFIFFRLEKGYRSYSASAQKNVSQRQAIHFTFSLCTFLCFNLFFFFSSRSLLAPFPFPVHLFFNGLIVLFSTLWLSRTFSRSAELYSRESLAGSLRRQLSKLTIDFSRFLEGRSMEDLKPEEVYVLAKVLPGFNQEQGLQVYKGVLREALEQGNTDSASSLEALRQLRQELNIKDEDHFTVLTELGSAEPDLLDPNKRRTRESQLRLESYRQALASMLLDLVDSGISLQEAMQRQRKQIQFLKLEYGMTAEEEDNVLNQLLAGEKSTILRKAETLIEQMQQLEMRYQVFSDQVLDSQTPVFQLLRLTAVQHKQQIITKQILGLLEVLGEIPEAIDLAVAIRELAAPILPEILSADGSQTWRNRLKPSIFAVLEKTLSTENHLQELDTRVNRTTANVFPDHFQPPEGLLLQRHELQAAVKSLATQARIQPSQALSVNSVMPRLTAVEMIDEVANEVPRQLSDQQPEQNQDTAISRFPASRMSPVKLEITSLTDVLHELLHGLDPLNQTLALYGLNLLTPQKALEQAKQMLNKQGHWLVQETAQALVDRESAQAADEVETLIVRVAMSGKVEKHIFQQPVVRVGSHSSNDLILLDTQIPPYHAVFYQDGSDFSLLDLGSGLSIDHQLIQNDRTKLSQGQMIQFGRAATNSPATTLTVNWEKQPLRTLVRSEGIGTIDKVLLLFESRFFKSLKPDALVELGRGATIKIYARGAQMCQAGDPSDSILLLIDGTAEVVVMRGRTQQVVASLNPGETIGEMGVLTRQKRSATVVAASDSCRVLVIQADKFDSVLRQDPEVARNLLVVLSTRLQSMTSRMKVAARSDVTDLQ